MDSIVAQRVSVGNGSTFRQGHDFHGPVTMVHQGKSEGKTITSINDVPDLLSPYFTARIQELEQIREILDTSHGHAPSRCVIYGMPGLGKTQLALKYSELAHKQLGYHFVFWMSAASVEKLNQGYSRLLNLLHLPQCLNPDQQAKNLAAQAWLEDDESENKRRWLLILDNVNQETAAHVREILPRKNNRGSILMTTREERVAESVALSFGERHPCIGIRTPDADDAVTLLLDAAGFGQENPKSIRFQEAKEIVKSVGCLPLAVDQVASYIRWSNSSMSQVLTLYKSKDMEKVLSWENDLSRYEEKSVMAAFTSMFKHLEQMSPKTVDFLRILAFLDPENISIDMLKDGCVPPQEHNLNSRAPTLMHHKTSSKSAKPLAYRRLKDRLNRLSLDSKDGKRALENITSDEDNELDGVWSLLHTPIDFQQTIRYLQNSSLVRRQKDGETLTLWVHDLVQSLLRTTLMRESEQKKWLQYAISVVWNAFKKVGDVWHPKIWLQCNKLVVHVQRLQKHAEEYKLESIELFEAGSQVAEYFMACGRYNEALEINKQIYILRKKVLGADHLDTLTSMNNISLSYMLHGMWAEAEEMNTQSLTAQKKLLGKKHILTMESTADWALIYINQDKLEEAETLLEQLLKVQKKVLGEEHRATVRSMDILVDLFRDQNRLIEAEKLCKRIIGIWRKIIGEEDQVTVNSMTQLAWIYSWEGKLVEADELLLQVVGIQKRMLGGHHPGTMWNIQQIAKLYMSMNRMNEAVKWMEDVVDTYNRSFGDNNPITLYAIKDLKRLRDEVEEIENSAAACIESEE